MDDEDDENDAVADVEMAVVFVVMLGVIHAACLMDVHCLYRDCTFSNDHLHGIVLERRMVMVNQDLYHWVSVMKQSMEYCDSDYLKLSVDLVFV